MERKKVTKWTKGIPICPYCNKPTQRIEGLITGTLMSFAPIYNEEGNNINPDRNIHSISWYCDNCGKDYGVSGNTTDGFYYSSGIKEQV